MPPSTVTRPRFGVERQHAIERASVDEDRALAELLPTHRVTAAGDRDGLPGGLGAKNRLRELMDVPGRDDSGDLCCVQLGVDVVDEHTTLSNSRPCQVVTEL